MSLEFNKQHIESLIDSLLRSKSEAESLRNQFEGDKQSLSRFEEEIQLYYEQIKLFTESKEIYALAVEEVYRRSLGHVQSVLNTALKFIFYDKSYSVIIEISDFKTKRADIIFLDNSSDPPKKVNAKGGIGNGVRSVISFILLGFFVIAEGGSRDILADEAYTAISSAYLPKFMQFAESLCKSKELCMALITHDPRIMDFADFGYTVSDGVVEEKIK